MELAAEVSQWYAFRVRSRHEKLVSTALRGKGYREFLPLARSNRKWSDRSITLDLPLFPGYIFCDIERGDIGRIRGTFGVVDVVRAGTTPLPASRPEVENLRKAAQWGMDLEPCPYIPFAVADRVRIDQGPLAGFEGTVAEHRGRERLVLSVELLQRSVYVELRPSSVSSCASEEVAPARARGFRPQIA